MRWLPVIFWLLIPAPARAAGTGTEDLWITGLKMIGSLVIVVGVILLLYAISRKGFGFLPTPKGGNIRVVEMRHIMPKKALCLVEVKDRTLLLGVGSERIELLAELGRRPGPSFDQTLQTESEVPQ